MLIFDEDIDRPDDAVRGRWQGHREPQARIVRSAVEYPAMLPDPIHKPDKVGAQRNPWIEFRGKTGWAHVQAVGKTARVKLPDRSFPLLHECEHFFRIRF